jgi:hypothetical protein
MRPFIQSSGEVVIGLESLQSRGFDVDIEVRPKGDGKTLSMRIARTGSTFAGIYRAGIIFDNTGINTDPDWLVYLDSGVCAWCGVNTFPSFPTIRT